MTFEQQLEVAIRLGVAAIGGMAVGIEREWSGQKDGERPRFAGVRTFLLIGLLGALAVLLTTLGSNIAGLLILTASATVIVIAYAASAYRGTTESTTEFAAILVLAAGALAGFGHLAIASAINVLVAFILMEKGRIHSFVFHLESGDLAAGLRFAVLAVVVLPLLPEGPFGPEPGIRPRELWALVLLFSGLSFLGLIARRAAGAERGYIVAGMIGGILSSTVVTLTFARESRTNNTIGKALALGVIAACTVLPIRVAVVMLILNSEVALSSLMYLSFAFVAGILYVFLVPKKDSQKQQESKLGSPKNPLRLLTAIQMVFAFQAALYVFHWVQKSFGTSGVLVSSAIAGLTDMDTLLFMIGKQSSLDLMLAVQALIVGIISNTILKLILSLAIGSKGFRLFAVGGLLMIFVALMVALLII